MAQPLRLNIAIADYGHTQALKSGAVRIEGVEPNFIEVVPIIGAFRRMVRDVEFDVCEMAPTTYMIARAWGSVCRHPGLPDAPLPSWWIRRSAGVGHQGPKGPRRKKGGRPRLL